MKGLFWKICKAYTPKEFLTEMRNLQDVQPDAYHKLCEAGPERWSRAHCPLVRYNYMTSNSVESVNACTVLYRKLPLLKLAETYRAMVQEWYFKRRELADGRYNREVDFKTGTCQCRKWQLSRIPYGHVLVVTRNMQDWEFPHHIQKAIPPRIDNLQSGHPKNTNRIQSQGEEKRVIPCTRCSQARHRCDQCNKPFVTKPPVHTRRQHDQEIPRNEQPSFYNPNQQYDNTFQSYNQYSSQPYGQTTYPSQPYDQHNTNTSEPYDGNHIQSSQMYEQYDP
ncbi:hypothetical protein Tco_1104121 [Tanacetum coccineum]